MYLKTILSFIFLFAVLSCNRARFNSFRGEALSVDAATLKEGKKAAEKHCSACHLVPQPESMTQVSAHFMLAYMGLFLGVDASRQLDPLEKEQFRNRYELLKRQNKIPVNAMVLPNEWHSLKAWYLASARHPFESSEEAHEASLTEIGIADRGVTLLARLSHGGFAVGGGMSGTLFFLDANLRTIKSIPLDSPPVHLVETPDAYYVLTLGSLLGSLDADARSSIYKVSRQGYQYHKILWDLPRAAHFLIANLNNDNTPDFVVALFGNVVGGGVLACTSQRAKYACNTISERESVVRLAEIKSEKPGEFSFLALAGGAREGLFRIDYKAGVSRKKSLVDYPPHLGSVWLEVVDIDKDGTDEILVLSGDNADQGPYNEVKNDQGLRIYRFANGTLTQKGFESLPGALSLVLLPARDGVSIAVSRFYTDPVRKQDLTLLTHTKGLNFSRKHFTLSVRPTVLATNNQGQLLVGSGNIPIISYNKEGTPLVREFSGPALGLLKIQTP